MARKPQATYSPVTWCNWNFNLGHNLSAFQDMGFSHEQAEAAIKQFGSVQQALDSLLAGVGKDLRLRGSHGNTPAALAAAASHGALYNKSSGHAAASGMVPLTMRKLLSLQVRQAKG